MCTSMAFVSGDFYFGRNMDLEGSFGEKIVITPRNFPFPFRHGKTLESHYAMIGMASIRSGYPLYAEGANEKGLCITGLSFSDNAFYPDETDKSCYNIATFELIPWILGTCATAEEAREKLKKTRIVSTAFEESLPPAQLHWHIADRKCSLVLEVMQDGMHLYENPTGVLTNNPPFPFHLANLNCYLNLTNAFPRNRFDSDLPLRALGVGFGSIGLPGDSTSVSRFVRTVFYKNHSLPAENEEEAVSQFFHIMDGVSMIRGAQLGFHGAPCQTTYTCCFNATKGIFYYKTYENSRITAVNLAAHSLDAKKLTSFDLIREQQFFYL